MEAAAHAARSARTRRKRRAGSRSRPWSEREKQVRTQEVRLGQDRAQLASAQFDLSKVRIESPIAGIVTRRNIQEGETAVVGTMNNAGTVLLTVADMSVIQAEVEVDETNIPNVTLGQAGEDHDRRDTRSHVQGARDRNRQQPDSGHRSGGHESAGDQLQSRRRARRGSAGRSARVHVHGRHHDSHAQERGRRSDSGGGRARAHLRRKRQHREEAADREPRARRSRRAAGSGARTGSDAQGNRGCVRHPRRASRVRSDQDRHRRRPVLRGAVGDQSRRSRSSPVRTTTCAP